MAEIFLSYRRQDSPRSTERLAEALVARFGDERVFRDTEDIFAGEDFVAAIRRSVEVSTVLLAVVGPRWLTAADAAGRRRLDDPADFVRLEIELALSAGVAVIPVLVEGATMPSAAALPESLQAFARCQAVEISEKRWQGDVERLIATLQARFAIESDALRPPDNAPSARGLLRWASRAVVDLLDLALHPTRLVDRRHTGRATDFGRALAFAAGSILAGNAMLAAGLGTPTGTTPSTGTTIAAVASWLLAGELVGLIVAGLLGALLALAWRIAGAARRHRLVGIVWAYVYSGAWFGFCLGLLVIGSALLLVDPNLLERTVLGIREAMTSGTAVDASIAGRLPDWGSSPFIGTARMLMLLGLALWLATLGWCIAAWGAFRQTLGASRAQSAAATSLWLAMLAGVVWLARLLG